MLLPHVYLNMPIPCIGDSSLKLRFLFFRFDDFSSFGSAGGGLLKSILTGFFRRVENLWSKFMRWLIISIDAFERVNWKQKQTFVRSFFKELLNQSDPVGSNPVLARSLKKSELWRDSNPWPPRYQCNALPTELWSHKLGARTIYWLHMSREEWNNVNCYIAGVFPATARLFIG